VARRRPAYTLIEVILVLTLLVVIGALAIPAIDAMQAGPRLTAATDMVRARLSEARVHAIEERLPYRFAVKNGTGIFRAAPDTSDFWDDGTGGPAGQGDGSGWVFDGTLPDKVTFTATNDGPGDSGGEWQKVCTFQADGSAMQDAEVIFYTRGATPARLRLRAATGAVTTAALMLPLPQHGP
jgi:Tfp pilus assembly protein FimT